MFKGIKTVGSMLLLFCFINDGNTQSINPPYPRFGIQQNQHSENSGGGRNSNGSQYDVLAKYDFVLTRSHYGGENVNIIKGKNPKAIVLATFDRLDPPQGWELRTANGDIVEARFKGVFPNYTSYNNGEEGARRYAIKRLDEIGFPNNPWDGYSQDSMNDRIYSKDATDVDFDRNGVNDFNEHGKSWVNERWRECIATMYKGMKAEMERRNPGGLNLTFANSGNFLKYWHDAVNGFLYEGWMRWAENWPVFIKNYLTQRKDYLKPEIRYVKNYNGLAGPEKDNFKLMRYGLSTTLMGDGYYGFQSSGEYHFSYWYDEFEAKLGYPTGPAQKLSVDGHEVWLRYFDKGAVLCVPDAEGGGYPYTVRVPASILQGTYYRFRGGQDPNFNNGQPFQDQTFTITKGYKAGKGVGDGILLFREPTVIISDIIIGNYRYHDTSPGNVEAEYSGSWEPLTSNITGSGYTDNPYYGMLFWAANGTEGKYRDKFTLFGYKASSQGGGESKATYRPKINIAGDYEVFEWHGWHGDTQGSFAEATNVPYKIKHATRTDLGTIDQTRNYGKWNSLGVYRFDKGNQNYFEMTNAANGWVISDAVKFVFQGNTDPAPDPSDPPPNPPRGVKVERN